MSTLPNRTPPWIARHLGVKESKVLHFITTGELVAVNLAERKGGRPRWKVSDQAIADFLAARTAGADAKPKTQRRTSQTPVDPSFVEYF